VDAARIGATGFADHLIAGTSFAAGANDILTFEKIFGRQPRVRRLS
jgi:predicted nucleic-acid-binding protein